MDLKSRLRHGLTFTRDFTMRLLQDFTEAEHWIVPTSEGNNHALWIAGHLAVADDFFAGLADGKTDVRDDYRKQFGKGSTPTYDLSDYPEPSVVLEYMQGRHVAVLDALEACSEADLAQATPDNAPPFMPDRAAMFQMMTWHESLHSGQLTAIRRQLGHTPVA